MGGLYDTYAKGYNKGRISIADLTAVSGRMADSMQQIDDRLTEIYGFSMDAWPLIEKASRKQRAEVFQEWVDKYELTEYSFNEAFSIIFAQSRRYFTLLLERGLVEIVMFAITKQGHPDSIKTWDELTEAEKEEIKSGAGNPYFIEKKIPQPEDFDDELQKLMNTGNPTQASMACDLIDHYEKLEEKNFETVKGWIRNSKHWKNRK